MNYYPFHLGDFASHAGHLDPIEDCAYRRLIDLYMLTEQPLPLDVDLLARKIRMKDYAEAVRDVLNEFFTQTDDAWTHSRCDKEIDKFRRASESASKAGKASALQRKATDVQPNPTGVQQAFNDRSTTVQPTKNQEPRTKTKNQDQVLKHDLPTANGDLLAEGSPGAVVIDMDSRRLPELPFDELVGLYHQVLPMCPRVLVATDHRKRHASARWRAWAAMDGWESKEQGLQEWRAFFELVAQSKFLTGRAQSQDSSRLPFTADFDWLMKPSNWQKTFEGKYNTQRVAR
jgi:uncharacterized protein YdaU (DUF1376 family)